jgi:hypothetical protein
MLDLEGPVLEDSKSYVIDLLTIKRAICFVKEFTDEVVESTLKLLCDKQVLPGRDSVEKIIRCEAAAERSLSRALERLECLQLKRKQEEAARRATQY